MGGIKHAASLWSKSVGSWLSDVCRMMHGSMNQGCGCGCVDDGRGR